MPLLINYLYLIKFLVLLDLKGKKQDVGRYGDVIWRKKDLLLYRALLLK